MNHFKTWIKNEIVNYQQKSVEKKHTPIIFEPLFSLSSYGT